MLETHIYLHPIVFSVVVVKVVGLFIALPIKKINESGQSDTLWKISHLHSSIKLRTRVIKKSNICAGEWCFS